jgi:hypothetical protein
VGFHFPTAVVAQVCNHYGIRLSRDGRVVDETNGGKLSMKVYQKGELVLDENVKDQVTINTEAKETIKDLFPNIPDNDLFQIIKTAFQLGRGRVGTAEEIPLPRRATLSVVAHIRHVYTNYDKLLRRLPYNNARHEVEEETLAKMVEWRGDASDNDGIINEILDDVIVISDEDNDSDHGDAQQVAANHVTVEELDGDAYWPAPARRMSPARTYLEEIPTYRYEPVPRQYQPSEAEFSQRQRNLAARWEQARQAARPQAGPSYQRTLIREPSPVRHLIPLDPPQGSVLERQYLAPAAPLRDFEVGAGLKAVQSSSFSHDSILPLRWSGTDSGQVLSSRPQSPAYVRPRSPIYARPAEVRYERIIEQVPQHSGHVSYGPRPMPVSNEVKYLRRSESPARGNGVVLPSIEGPNGALSPRIARQNEQAHTHNQNATASYRDRREVAGPMDSSRFGAGHNANHDHRPQDSYESRKPRNPFRSLPESPRTVQNGSPRNIKEVTGSRWVDDGIREHHEPVERITVVPRENPFDNREPQMIRRLEAIDDDYRRPNPATPTRRLLEPMPSGQSRSDLGPQRYTSYMPASEPVYMPAPAPVERRIIYAEPTETYVRRYEPVPDPTYVRR